jgi:hypothetical protein
MNDPLFYSRHILDLIQWFSVPWFALTVFRLKPRNYWIQCMYLAIICNFVPEQILKLTGVPELLLLTQVVIEIICFWIIFRFSLLYASLMSFIGMIFVVVLQMTILYILSAANHTTIQAILENQITYHIAIITLILGTYLLARLLGYYRIGFTFVKNSKRVDLFNSANKKLIASLFAVIFIIGLMPGSPSEQFIPLITFITLLLALFLGILLKLSYKKEMEED